MTLPRLSPGFLVRTALVLGCAAYVLSGIDLGEFLHVVADFDPFRLLAVFLLSCVPNLLMAARLTFLTQGRAPVWPALLAVFFGLGMNNIFPAKLGEVAKAFYLRTRCSVPLAQGLGLIFWERFADLNMLLAVGVLSALLLGASVVFVPLALMVGGVWVCVALIRLWPGSVDLACRFVPMERARLLLCDMAHQLRDTMAPARLLGLGAYTLVTWCFHIACVFAVIFWVVGLPLTWAQALTVFTISVFGIAMPSSPGGMGVYEASIVFAMALFGVGKEEALAVGLTLRLYNLLPTVSVALLLLSRTGFKLEDLRRKTGDSL